MMKQKTPTYQRFKQIPPRRTEHVAPPTTSYGVSRSADRSHQVQIAARLTNSHGQPHDFIHELAERRISPGGLMDTGTYEEMQALAAS